LARSTAVNWIALNKRERKPRERVLGCATSKATPAKIGLFVAMSIEAIGVLSENRAFRPGQFSALLEEEVGRPRKGGAVRA
jgi:hypothetical protein